MSEQRSRLMQAIESVRQAAYNDGFAAGRALENEARIQRYDEGFAAGYAQAIADVEALNVEAKVVSMVPDEPPPADRQELSAQLLRGLQLVRERGARGEPTRYTDAIADGLANNVLYRLRDLKLIRHDEQAQVFYPIERSEETAP
jgi:hypothetical protein